MVMTALEQGRLGVPNPEGVGDGGERGAVFFIFLQILYDGQSTGFDITLCYR